MITKEQYEFLKERLKDAELGRVCTVEIKRINACEQNCLLYNEGFCTLVAGQRCVDKINELMQQYKKEIAMDKKLKFENKTRGGHNVIIHTTEGMDKNFPLVGEYEFENGEWGIATWKTTGRYFIDDEESPFDLIPVKPLPLEGKKVGDFVYGYDGKITGDCKVVGFRIIKKHNDDGFWIGLNGLWCLPVKYSGEAIGFGNGKQLFFPTEEEARKSVEEER